MLLNISNIDRFDKLAGMELNQPILEGVLVKRYKRFLADVLLPDGTEITVHCPNSGSMRGCAQPGYRVIISDSQNPKRKLRYTLEWVHNGECWIGINTHRSNDLVEEAIRLGIIEDLKGYDGLQREVKYGIENKSRIDILLTDANGLKCFVEVKNVSLISNHSSYQFPDAVTDRGLKHIHELATMIKEGHRAVMFFVINRSDANFFEPAWEIDPKYSQALVKAVDSGLEVMAYQVHIEPPSASLVKLIDICLEVPDN